ncbi:small cell adhesion glycoprotein isoform X2 [Caretta caretta]|uniref:small cell adhesion glycoprotein isoform X2 n=1 Tax=Caretta caretta TaxID=8467 RepID=UPI002095C3A5|nr:small cell adhesion glycoprotein isoform X2 [Caretta caretta]
MWGNWKGEAEGNALASQRFQELCENRWWKGTLQTPHAAGAFYSDDSSKRSQNLKWKDKNTCNSARSMAATPPPLLPTELTTPFLKRINTPSLQEEASVGVIAGVITVVFITLLTVLVIIITYLYKNKGSYHTYEQPEADVSVEMENLPSKGEKEEYFI